MKIIFIFVELIIIKILSMETLEFKNGNRQTVQDGITDFLIKAKRDDSEIVVVNVNIFYNPFDEHWYGQVSHYGN